MDGADSGARNGEHIPFAQRRRLAIEQAERRMAALEAAGTKAADSKRPDGEAATPAAAVNASNEASDVESAGVAPVVAPAATAAPAVAAEGTAVDNSARVRGMYCGGSRALTALEFGGIVLSGLVALELLDSPKIVQMVKSRHHDRYGARLVPRIVA